MVLCEDYSKKKSNFVFYEFGKKGYKISQYIIVSVELYSRIALLFLKKEVQ